MVVLQCGACAICGFTPSEDLDAKGGQAILYVDHNHASGEGRQLLCYNCNTLLGFSKDNPVTLLEAAAYLKEFA